MIVLCYLVPITQLLDSSNEIPVDGGKCNIDTNQIILNFCLGILCPVLLLRLCGYYRYKGR